MPALACLILAAAPARAAALCIEAEHANSLDYPLEIVEQEGASGGLAMAVPEGAGSMEAFRGRISAAVFCVPIPEQGTWRAWLRVKWNGVCSNSVFFQAAEGDVQAVMDATMQRWHWAEAGAWKLPAGMTQLRLINREDGVWVDQILLTTEKGAPADAARAADVVPRQAAEARSPVVLMLSSAPGRSGLPPTDFTIHHDPMEPVALDTVRRLIVLPGRPAELTGWLRNNSLEATSVRVSLHTEAPLDVAPSAEQAVELAAGEPLRKFALRFSAPADMPHRTWPLTVRVQHADGRIEAQHILVERPMDWLVTDALPCTPDLGIETPGAVEKQAGRDFPGGAGGVRWRAAAPEAVTPFGLLDMRAAVADRTYVMAYAWTQVVSPEDGEFLLDVRHDDMIRIWLNGEDVFTNTRTLPSDISRKLVKVKLRKGTNDLLVKICQEKNYWEFGVHFLTLDGHPAPVTGTDVGPPAAKDKTSDAQGR